MGLTRRRFLETAVATGLPGAGSAFARIHRRRNPPNYQSVIKVRAKPGSTNGILAFEGKTYTCMLGNAGILHPKFEGDGGTPEGLFPLREVRYRPDRGGAPKTRLPVYKTLQNDGWCDDPADAEYNKIVALPHQTDAEALWREDFLYDVLAVIGYNDDPVVPGAGSAIFLHVMRPPADDHQYTAGCVALKKEDLLTVLSDCRPGTAIDIRTL